MAMRNLIKSEKGNITLASIVIAMLVLIFTLPIIAILQSNFEQSIIQIKRIQDFYANKAEFVRITNKLYEDISYLYYNQNGTMGISNYEVTDAIYENETQQVWNEYTEDYEEIVIVEKYIYSIKIGQNEYKICCRKELLTNKVYVTLL